MTTSSNRKRRVFLVLILCSFLATHLCFRLLPNVFEMANAQAIDQLYILRTSLHQFRPDYDPTVVHVDLNNASIQRLKHPYLNRGHYARLIRNLSAMGVSAQVFDFIFAARKDAARDAALVQLKSPLPFECDPFKGKTVIDAGISGQILMVGKAEAEVFLSRPVAAHTNLRILLASSEQNPTRELYARVVPGADADADVSSDAIRLRFTWVPEEVTHFFAHHL